MPSRRGFAAVENSQAFCFLPNGMYCNDLEYSFVAVSNRKDNKIQFKVIAVCNAAAFACQLPELKGMNEILHTTRAAFDAFPTRCRSMPGLQTHTNARLSWTFADAFCRCNQRKLERMRFWHMSMVTAPVASGCLSQDSAKLHNVPCLALN